MKVINKCLEQHHHYRILGRIDAIWDSWYHWVYKYQKDDVDNHKRSIKKNKNKNNHHNHNKVGTDQIVMYSKGADSAIMQKLDPEISSEVKSTLNQ